jgi:hypothetical protein
VGYEIVFTVSERILSLLPRVILKRTIYKESKLKEAIKIDTRTVNPIIFTTTSYIPTVNAYFTITNLTDLAWRVDDFSAEVWIGQPLAISTCLDKPTIPKRKQCDIYTKSFLNEAQVRRLNEEKSKGRLTSTIYTNAYLESKIGLVKVEATLENRQIIIQ